VLLVDDVWDSGTTIVAFYDTLEKNLLFPLSQLDIRVATVYYKAKRNHTALTPKYFMHDSNEWLVFPHELEGMSEEEIEKVMGKEIADIIKDIPELKK
jgi:hypoxanthine phosphoribosyltransferase